MTASLPSGYVEVDRWDLARVSGRQRVGALVLSFVAVFVTMGVGLGAVSLAGGEPALRVDLPRILAGGLLGLVLHELSHAAAFLALGGRPRFGGKVWTRLGPVLSVSAPGAYFTRGAYLFAGVGAVLVLGVVLIGVGAVAPEGGAVAAIAIIAATVNVAGAGGDAIIALAVRSYPPVARFEDTGDGFVVYEAA